MDWVLLLPGAIALVILSWPVGSWHLWSFLWIGTTILVLTDEVIGKFSPDHKTISDQMRVYRKNHTVKFWFIMSAWLIFCWTLIIHLAT